MSCIGQPLAMRMIVLHCFGEVSKEDVRMSKLVEMASGISRDDSYGNKKKKRRRARKSTYPKRSKRVKDKKVESKDRNDKKQLLASVQNLYQAFPNERQKMLLCVDFLAAVTSLDRTQEQKDHYKSKCVMCAESTYLQRSTFAP